jgi:hypothetical protein
VETFVKVGGVQELCGAVSKREEDVPGFSQYRDRISLIVGQLVRIFFLALSGQDKFAFSHLTVIFRLNLVN